MDGDTFEKGDNWEMTYGEFDFGFEFEGSEGAVQVKSHWQLEIQT